MKFDPEIHHRHSIRLRDFDYARAGAYFVTVCVQGRECLLGAVADGGMVLNEAGEMVERWWNAVPMHFPLVELDECVIMPNHFHGIIWIVGAGSPRPVPRNVGAGSPRPIPPDPQYQGGETPPLRRPTLGQIMGYFKYQSAKAINQIRDTPGTPVWQRNYYERIVRDDEELTAIRAYIRDNPGRWAEDAENPARMRNPDGCGGNEFCGDA